jgi:AmmeMemoRadiSam system protein A
MLKKQDQQFLLKLSRKALEFYFQNQQKLPVEKIDIKSLSKDLLKPRATFVTLTIKDTNTLRGCIGKLTPTQECYLDALENTYSAAFSDPRFPPLEQDQLGEIQIEISILSKPKPLVYQDTVELIEKLEVQKPGVVLKHDFHQATFLPQVWEQLKTPQEFLSHLCQKAGLQENFWQIDKPKIETYSVEKFTEHSPK